VEGEYLIESALKPGLLLDVTGAKAEDLALIQLAGPGDEVNRRWKFIPVRCTTAGYWNSGWLSAT